jgi:hypothetical protein
MFSSGLYLLDGLLLGHVERNWVSVRECFTVGSSYLSYLHQRRSNSQAQHTVLGNTIKGVWETEFAVTHAKKNRLTADEAVALLFLSRLYVRICPMTVLAERLVEALPQLEAEKEQRLFRRDTEFDIGGDHGKSV